jgi:hypothetical protein
MDEDTDTHQSADDALEPADDIFNPLRDEEKLPQDGDSPAAPPSDITGAGTNLPIDDPHTDTSVDQHEMYDEGLAGATETNSSQEGPDDSPRPLQPEE